MSDYYVGLDVHKARLCVAVINADSKLVMESVIETSDQEHLRAVVWGRSRPLQPSTGLLTALPPFFSMCV